MKASRILGLAAVSALLIGLLVLRPRSRNTQAPPSETEAPEEPTSEQQSVAQFVSAENHIWSWAELVSTNYPAYLANLRAAGCPELSITSLVIGDVNRAFRPYLAVKRAEFLKNNSFDYWTATSKGPGRNVLAKWADLEQNVNDERIRLINSYIATQLPTEGIAPISLGLNGDTSIDSSFSVLPKQMQGPVRQQFSDLQDQLIQLSRKGVSGQDLLAALEIGQNEIYKSLQTTLSEDQILQLKLRTSNLAGRLREELAYMQPTEEEFRSIYSAFEDARVEIDDPILVEAAANRKLRELLNADRIRELSRSRSGRYSSIAGYCEQNEISNEIANQLYDLYLEAASAAPSGSTPASTTINDIQARAAGILADQYESFANSSTGSWLKGEILPDSSMATYGAFPINRNPFKSP